MPLAVDADGASTYVYKASFFNVYLHFNEKNDHLATITHWYLRACYIVGV